MVEIDAGVLWQVIRIETAWKGQPPPFAKLDGNYHSALVGSPRTDIKPLDVVQPEGPSFTVRASLPLARFQ